jgi:pyridoxal phosphate enzyme (YggS family)
MTPGQRFRQFREKKHLLVDDILQNCDVTGFSTSAIYDLEQCEGDVEDCYSGVQVAKFCRVLGVRAVDLFAPEFAEAPISVETVVDLIRNECATRKMTVEQFEDVVGWSLAGYLNEPQKLLADMTIAGLQWLCRELRIDWKRVLAALPCDPMDFATNFKLIQQRVNDACARVGRPWNSVTLVAVSKNRTPDEVREAAACGQTLFGENRVQEGKLKTSLCPGNLRWHMIGHLQSNKVRDAVHFFQMIESVDSLALAQEINKWADKSAKTMRILLEVNVTGESSKFGYRPDALLAELEQINALPKIEIHGLMTVAPWAEDPEKVRPVFRRMRELKEQCEEVLGAPLPHLSMGMSGDFEVAIEEGATMIRIGTALFGPRLKAKDQ